MHRVTRRRAVRMVRKHGFLPVPSYGLREAHSPNLVEVKFSELRMYGVLRSSPIARSSKQSIGPVRAYRRDLLRSAGGYCPLPSERPPAAVPPPSLPSSRGP